jgi:L-histidine Nalpha-methyltransferase
MGQFYFERLLVAGFLQRSLRADVREGLTSSPKRLPPKWFYDSRGSELFEAITRQPEYYPTRTERSILAAEAGEIAEVTRARSLIEFGSGSSEKTRLLLGALRDTGSVATYLAIDISEDALVTAGRRLAEEYPGLTVRATAADFEDQANMLPIGDAPGPRLIAFLGGTIGQFLEDERASFLRTLRSHMEPGDMLLLGTDLVKQPGMLEAAYSDAAGVSADFNKNLLTILNTELGADFDRDAFDHVVAWDPAGECVAMWLQSGTDQTVRLPAIGLSVHFIPGERIRTGTSVKFRREKVQGELASAGLAMRRWWTDPDQLFAMSLSAAA